MEKTPDSRHGLVAMKGGRTAYSIAPQSTSPQYISSLLVVSKTCARSHHCNPEHPYTNTNTHTACSQEFERALGRVNLQTVSLTAITTLQRLTGHHCFSQLYGARTFRKLPVCLYNKHSYTLHINVTCCPLISLSSLFLSVLL